MFTSAVTVFADALDEDFTNQNGVESVTKLVIRHTMMKYSQILFNGPTKTVCTNEKRLLIYIQTIREGYREGKVNDIKFIWSELNISDVPIGPEAQSIMDVLASTTSSHPID